MIDKDHAAALLVEALEAEVLMLLADVPPVWTLWPMSVGRPIARTTPMELRTLTFAAGSMRPKVGAACRSVERTGRIAAIGAIDQAEGILEGAAGTSILMSTTGLRAPPFSKAGIAWPPRWAASYTGVRNARNPRANGEPR